MPGVIIGAIPGYGAPGMPGVIIGAIPGYGAPGMPGIIPGDMPCCCSHRVRAICLAKADSSNGLCKCQKGKKGGRRQGRNWFTHDQ